MAADASAAQPARRPLDEGALRDALHRLPPWREVRVLAETASTNDDVAAAARAGEREGLVVVAELQTGGRGRQGRAWVAPRAAGLTFSVLLRPAVPAERWPWLPLLAGMAVGDGVRRAAGVDTRLKWPNDVLVGGDKLAGLLVEVVEGAAVVGVGLNVSANRDELPRPDATSIALQGAAAERGDVLLAILAALGARYLEWARVGGDPTGLGEDYRGRCATLGRAVRVALPGGAERRGTAVDVDEHGRLVVEGDDGRRHCLSAGDVEHVR